MGQAGDAARWPGPEDVQKVRPDRSMSALPGNPMIDWLPWDRSPIREAAARLVALGCEGSADECDLSSVTIVVSNARARRVLLWHLLERTEAEGMRLVPPAWAAPGELADLVAPPLRRLATAREHESALISALMASTEAPRVFPVLRGRDFDSFRAIAETIRSLQEQLDRGGKSIDDAVAFAPKSARDRWRAIGAIARDAEERLASVAIALPWSVERGTRPSVRHVVLLLSIELPTRAHELLGEADERDLKVSVLAHAPDEMRNAFDRWGLLRSDAWAERSFEVPLDWIRLADHARDAAQLAIGAALRASSEHTLDEIVIGVPDPAFEPPLVMAGDWAHAPVRLAQGPAFESTQCWRLMEGVIELIESPPRHGEANVPPAIDRLVRLPCVAEWLAARSGSIGAIDVPAAIDRLHSVGRDARAEERSLLDEIIDAFAEVLAPLAEPRTLVDWAEPLREVLAALLQDAPAEHPEEEAVGALSAELESWVRLPAELCDQRVDAMTAIGELLRSQVGRRIPEPPRSDALEALGWLELHADDSPILILVGFHEGVVPSADSTHPLLTPQMIEALGLPDERVRAARDAYLLEAMVQGRERVTIVVARRSPSTDPVFPSRLLLRGDPANLPRRVLRLTDASAAIRVPQLRGIAPALDETRFVIPPVTPTEPPNSMSVTAFRTYLACPYRFWLSRILRLEAFELPEAEMDPMQFGTVLHDALYRFGSDATLRRSSREREIADFLIDAVDAEARSRFGSEPPLARQIQLAWMH